MTVKEKALQINKELEKIYPDPVCALGFNNGIELLVAVRLSAQCTDKRVNEVTPALFAKYKTAEDFANADIEELEGMIKSCGFYHDKAKSIKEFCRMIIDVYGGVIPDSIDELVKLPGVGRKTANLVMGELYGKESYVCDTHCIRLSNRFGLTKSKDPAVVEKDLRAAVPPEISGDFCHRFVWYGRDVCTARNPKCDKCSLKYLCAEKAK